MRGDRLLDTVYCSLYETRQLFRDQRVMRKIGKYISDRERQQQRVDFLALLEPRFSAVLNPVPDMTDENFADMLRSFQGVLMQFYDASQPECSVSNFQDAMAFFSRANRNVFSELRVEANMDGMSITPDHVYGIYLDGVENGVELFVEYKEAQHRAGVLYPAPSVEGPSGGVVVSVDFQERQRSTA